MKLLFKSKVVLVAVCLFLLVGNSYSQGCTSLGQTPTTAFPVCGITTFHQSVVPLCATNDLFVPGCSGPGSASYQNKNPFFYQFTCYASGTLGFLITPLAANEDYDWQLYDITGHNPNDIFFDDSLVVTGNWAGTYGPTGASATGVNFIQCASDPAANPPASTFSAMPNLIVGHTYLLMISHFTDTQSGYDLTFSGGTAVITDPKVPHMQNAMTDCSGQIITLTLNKTFQCNSLTNTGSEFSILPAVTTVTSAAATSCNSGFGFDTLTITLASALPSGNYSLVVNNGSDGNTLLDICGTAIAVGENVSFSYKIPQPISADSIGSIGCSPDSLIVYFPKRILCNSIAADGSNFSVTGPAPVSVTSAQGNCNNGLSTTVTVQLSAPIYNGGNYLLNLQAGTTGITLIDECGLPTLTQSIPFVAADTVSSQFSYIANLGCTSNTLNFTNNGANNINQWFWTFDTTGHSTNQSPSYVFPAISNNLIKLSVSNGVCSDSSTQIIAFNNEVKANFSMPEVICPEDALTVSDSSTGTINSWNWIFGGIATSNLQNPPPQYFPDINREVYYNITLIVSNPLINCIDSSTKILRVLNNCYIGVPSAFTPNGDGLNDYFWPHNALKADNLEFKVYDRWGQLVFQSSNWQQKWDGTFNGAPQPAGVYVWFLSYTNHDTGQKVFQKGTVMLIR